VSVGPVSTPLRVALIGDPNSVHTRRLASDLADRGHEIHLVVPSTDSIVGSLDSRVTVHFFLAWPRSRIRGVGLVRASRDLSRLMSAIRPDVLHSQSVSRYGLAAWLSRFRPYAITVWGSDVLIVPGLSRRRRIQTRLALAGAALVIAGSEHLRKAAIAAGARPARTRYVHLGVDVDRYSPGDGADLRARLQLGDSRVVLSPRAIGPIYRQDVVVDAFARLPADTLLLVTRHNAREAELAAVDARARALGVADRVRIVPPVSEADVPDLYRLSSVVVSVPASDGGPNAVVEALACGRPIVASDLPPNREWLSELDPDALVPVGDPEATAAALMAILRRSVSEAAARAERGRTAVRERADRRTSLETMEVLYRELARSRRGRI
jgi:glycosyltransferase involved in cell wall biosynthesis